MRSAMPKPTLDADTMLKRAAPVTGQHAHEIQPFGHLVRMPIALSEHACKESVDNLNQLLADTMMLRDLYKEHHSHRRFRSSPHQSSTNIASHARGHRFESCSAHHAYLVRR